MLAESELIEIGFSKEQAKSLLKDSDFVLVAKNKTKKDFEQRLKDAEKTYNVSREQVVRAVFSFPPFAGLDHARVLRQLVDVYGVSREQVVRAVFSHPRFAGYDHARVLRQASRLGKLIGLSKKEIIKEIFENPFLVSPSQKRNLASIDAIRNALKRSGKNVSNEQLFEWYKKHFWTTPYPVKGSKERETVLARQGKLSEPSKVGKLFERKIKKHIK